MSERESIDQAVKERFEKDHVSNIVITLAEDQFAVGNVYYVDFKSKNIDHDPNDPDSEEWEDDYFYALVYKDRVSLYDDGIEVIRALNTLLQRRKTFWQRFTEFSLVDIVGAVIAMSITLTFVAASLGWLGSASAQVDQHLVSIFTVIVGYYFGRVSSSVNQKN